jgi:hypothetical protein
MADVARFTELLFGDQTIDDLLTSLDKEAAPDGAWMLLSKAAEHMRQGEVGRAAEVLLEVAGNPKMETRILLWSWAALRCLGIHPKSYEADDIKGVVIQVPMESGVDVLAAYADGTARYVNHSGKTIVWEITDATITAIIRKLLESCKDLRGVVFAASPNHSVKDLVRVTLLTFTGNRFAEASMQSLASSPINQVLGVGAELMANLIKRSESMDRIVSKTSSAGNFQKGSKGVSPHY